MQNKSKYYKKMLMDIEQQQIVLYGSKLYITKADSTKSKQVVQHNIVFLQNINKQYTIIANSTKQKQVVQHNSKQDKQQQQQPLQT